MKRKAFLLSLLGVFGLTTVTHAQSPPGMRRFVLFGSYDLADSENTWANFSGTYDTSKQAWVEGRRRNFTWIEVVDGWTGGGAG